MAASRALPLLSTVAPRTEQAASAPSCHRCNREFGIITRRKICSHCGFAYCSSCCDHQAICPRSDTSHSGYDTVTVCTYCIDMLSITASGKSQLRQMPVTRLKAYLDAYGIKPKSLLEKDDLIGAIIDARGLNGGLSTDLEQYYRRNTIARKPPVDSSRRHNFFSSNRSSGPAPPPRPRSTGPGVQSSSQRPMSPPPRPGPPPGRNSDPRYQQHYSQPPYAQPHYQQPQYPQGQYHYQQPPYTQAHFQAPPSNQSAPPRQEYAPPSGPPPRATSPPPQPRWNTRPQSPPPPPQPQESFLRPPSQGRSRSRSVPSSEAPPSHQAPPTPSSPRPRAPQPVPLLATLLDKTKDDISAYNVSSLKGILQANHVNARLILEKGELVDKVMSLIEVERRERAREQAIHEAEERAAMEAQSIRMEQMRLDAERRAQASASASGANSPQRARSPPPFRTASPPPVAPGAFVERDGLCVVCQDEEANIAIVDCGHLALCMDCSHTIMQSTKECPLCRTRIVTEQRLLRIFRS